MNYSTLTNSTTIQEISRNTRNIANRNTFIFTKEDVAKKTSCAFQSPPPSAHSTIRTLSAADTFAYEPRGILLDKKYM